MTFPFTPIVSRRTLLAGGAACTAVLPFGQYQTHAASPSTAIDVVTRVLEVKGKPATVYGITINGKAAPLRQRYGSVFDAVVTNRTGDETLLHWHGLTPPLEMDGVPMLSGPVMKAGESRAYKFGLRDTGTHWMHSHVGLQEQLLMAAPFIVDEDGAALVDEQEHVVMLHDFTFRPPQDILAELQKGGGAHAAHAGHGNMTGMNMKGMDHSKHGAGNAGGMLMGGGMMLNDIVYDAMLANDRTLDDPEVVQVEKQGRMRLRIINGAAASNMWVDLGALEGELIAVDGRSIHPVKGSLFPLAIAQRADIRLALPTGSGAWPVLFRAEGSDLQSGIFLRSGDAAVPRLADRGTAAPALDLAFEAGLRSIAEPPDEPVARTEFVMLTGGGADYQWGLNGKSSMHDVLFRVREGERYEVVLHNMTGMSHPMHLHGHYFKVTGINGQRIKGALRDTVLVPPDQMVAIQFTADNPGTWAFHCHHMYHMNSGMMGAIGYSSAA